MPRYHVEAYGKKYEIESPTELSHDQIKKQLLSKETFGDKLKGFGASTFNGLVFGAGDLVAGAAKSASQDLNPYHPDKFKEGRKGFKDILQSYQELHPKSSISGEILGSLPTFLIPGTAAVKGISGASKLANMGKVAKAVTSPLGRAITEGVAYGATYGAGSGLSDTEDLVSAEALRNMGKGAAKNAVISGIGGLAGYGAIKGVDKLTKKGAVKKFIEKVGKEKVEEAITKETPLLDTADRAVLTQAEKLNLRSPGASQIFYDYQAQRMPKQLEAIADLTSSSFGEIGAEEAMDKIQRQQQSHYEPLYRQANQAGAINTQRKLSEETTKRIAELDTKIADAEAVLQVIPVTEQTKNPQLLKMAEELPQLKAERALIGETDILSNPRIQNAIKEWRKLYPEFDYLPDNSVQVLQGAKQRLNSKVSTNLKAGDKQLARMNEEAIEPLKEILTEQVPEYAQADKEFAKMKQLEQKVEEGQNFNTLSPSETRRLAETLTPENRPGFEAGIAETLRTQIAKAAKTDNSNVAAKVFDNNTLRKLEELGYDISDKAKAEIKAGKNLSELLGGSTTAKRLNIAPADVNAKNPFRKIGNKLLNFTGRQISTMHDETLAKALTDTKALRELAALASKEGVGKNIAEALRKLASISSRNFVGQEQ